jgi:hypothetical protein
MLLAGDLVISKALGRVLAFGLMIPTEAGHGFRFEAGHCSGMKPASIPE